MKLGICVLNWNTGETLTKCVDQLRAASSSYSAELIVVDNNSTDSSLGHLVSRVPDAQVIQNSRNLGYARGNNIGALHLCSRGCDYLLFVNPDAVMTEDSIGALVASLGKSEAAGAAGGLPSNADGISRMAARTRPSVLQKLILYGPLHRLPLLGSIGARHFLDWRSVKEGEPVYAVCGACLLFRSSVFQQVGGFDETTFLYEEELIMSERLQSIGSFFVLSKASTYFHAEACSTNRMPYRRRLHFIESEQYLLRAYYRQNFALRLAFRFWRYLEWVVYSTTWALGLKRKDLANSRSSGPLAPSTADPVARRRI